MGCSESISFETSIQIKSLSTSDTINLPSLEEKEDKCIHFENFDTYEEVQTDRTYFYDPSIMRVISIPHLKSIRESSIIRRRTYTL